MNTFLRAVEALLLGGWVGSWTFFALGVARVAFQVLPGADVAGQLVGPLLRSLHLYGLVAGVALAALAWRRGRGRLAIALPIGLALLCAVTEFGVTGAIAGSRPSEIASGVADPAAAERFRMLHRLSMGLFSVILLGAIGLVGLHATESLDEGNAPH